MKQEPVPVVPKVRPGGSRVAHFIPLKVVHFNPIGVVHLKAIR